MVNERKDDQKSIPGDSDSARTGDNGHRHSSPTFAWDDRYCEFIKGSLKCTRKKVAVAPLQSRSNTTTPASDKELRAVNRTMTFSALQKGLCNPTLGSKVFTIKSFTTRVGCSAHTIHRAIVFLIIMP